ncbi:hypothetical protein CCH79_00013317 [Gambusia affinis]|uniref:LRRCT domain-containing protein n=1 Tax=Gambusia affinis TaxID=33528 RepID=A0A315V0M2_GAMAF|nr:hypothetical protein CCH79_00013317 [Gambusia affinis]
MEKHLACLFSCTCMYPSLLLNLTCLFSCLFMFSAKPIITAIIPNQHIILTQLFLNFNTVSECCLYFTVGIAALIKITFVGIMDPHRLPATPSKMARFSDKLRCANMQGILRLLSLLTSSPTIHCWQFANVEHNTVPTDTPLSSDEHLGGQCIIEGSMNVMYSGFCWGTGTTTFKLKPRYQDIPHGGRLLFLVMWLNLLPQTESCPAKCVCYSEPRPTVACQQQGLFSIPTVIPVRSQRIFLQSNKLTVVRSTSFSSCHNLTVLWLYSNNIIYIEAGAFFGLEKLEELDIGDNSNLRTINPTAFRGLTKLHTLHLHRCGLSELPDNNIHTLHDDTFVDLANLTYLYLHNNKIKIVTDNMFRGVINLDRLLLHQNQYLRLNGNQWICDCRARTLWDWFKRFKGSSSELECYVPEFLAGKDLKQLKSEELEGCVETSQIQTTFFNSKAQSGKFSSTESPLGDNIPKCCLGDNDKSSILSGKSRQITNNPPKEKENMSKTKYKQQERTKNETQNKQNDGPLGTLSNNLDKTDGIEQEVMSCSGKVAIVTAMGNGDPDTTTVPAEMQEIQRNGGIRMEETSRKAKGNDMLGNALKAKITGYDKLEQDTDDEATVTVCKTRMQETRGKKKTRSLHLAAPVSYRLLDTRQPGKPVAKSDCAATPGQHKHFLGNTILSSRLKHCCSLHGLWPLTRMNLGLCVTQLAIDNNLAKSRAMPRENTEQEKSNSCVSQGSTMEKLPSNPTRYSPQPLFFAAASMGRSDSSWGIHKQTVPCWNTLHLVDTASAPGLVEPGGGLVSGGLSLQASLTEQSSAAHSCF